MFTVELAGIPLAINNYFDLVKLRCKGFETSKPPLFTVSATEEEMFREAGGSSGSAEELCIHRQIALKMMEYDAFLMHAAIIGVDEQGVAFAAKSGTGKTTQVLLWQQALGSRVKVVNGDKPIIRFTEEGLYAYGTPWRGKENLGGNLRVPLKHVCFLERGKEVSLCKLKSDEAVSRLFLQILIPRDSAGLDRFMALMARFLDTASFYLLKCDRDAEKPEKIWERIKCYQ